jgi:hypothetical protein
LALKAPVPIPLPDARPKNKAMRYDRDQSFWERLRAAARDPNTHPVSQQQWAQLKGYVAGGLLLALFAIVRMVTEVPAIVDRIGRIGAVSLYLVASGGILFALRIWLSRREMRIRGWPTIWPVVWVVAAAAVAAVWLFRDPHP